MNNFLKINIIVGRTHGKSKMHTKYVLSGLKCYRFFLLIFLMVNLIFNMGLTLNPVSGTFPGNNGRIAFSSDRDGDWEIYTMNVL